jgi:poly-gamma-glutamate synthesis protein (capsule biosynthesis protein)
LFIALAFGEPAAAEKPNGTWRLLAGGDIMTPAVLVRTAQEMKATPEGGPGGYGWALRELGPAIRRADLAFANLETPVDPLRPVSGRNPFNADSLYLDALKALGLDVLMLANNHVLDQGVAGIARTRDAVQSRGLLTVGAVAAGEPWEELLTVQVGGAAGIRIGFLNYTSGISDLSLRYNLEHLLYGRNINYALFDNNTPALKRWVGAIAAAFSERAVIPDRSSFMKRVQKVTEKAKEAGVEHLVAFLHWGRPDRHEPDANQRSLAQALCKHVDAVIAAGPHTVQPVEILPGGKSGQRPCLVAFSLGNLIGSRGRTGIYGLMLEWQLRRTQGAVELTGFRKRMIRTDRCWKQLPVSNENMPRISLRETSETEFAEFVRNWPRSQPKATLCLPYEEETPMADLQEGAPG